VKAAGVYRQHERSVLVLVDPDEREVLLGEDRCYVPAYLGPSGWVGVDLVDGVDWDEIGELLDASYRRTAGRRRVAALDARTAG
jgi:predicted DNA-binding protein (MmcQ/YjbR family)